MFAANRQPTDALRLNIAQLHIFGLWPKSKNRAYAIYGFCFYLFIVTTVTLSGIETLFVSFKDGVIKGDLENVCITLTHISVSIRIAILVRRRPMVMETLRKLDEWVLPVSGHPIVADSIQDGFAIARFHIGLCLVAITANCSAKLSAKGHVLLYSAHYPVDYVNSTLIYAFVYMYQCIGGLSTGTLVANLDTFPVAIMRVIGGRLDMIRETVRELGYQYDLVDNKDRNKKKEKKRFLKMLKDCIVHHQQMVELSSEVEDVFAIMILMQAMLSIVILCISVYQSTLVSPTESVAELIMFVYMMFYACAMSRQIYLPCKYANEITLKSELLLNEAFSSKWYEQDPEFKKVLFIFMERIKRPITFTAYGLMDINLETFKRICNSAYSLYAVLDTA